MGYLLLVYTCMSVSSSVQYSVISGREKVKNKSHDTKKFAVKDEWKKNHEKNLCVTKNRILMTLERIAYLC